jgi:ectoine hydroxylase-related dioxygenase (phytanoyl-CoA dioxygenase family)
MSRPQIETVEPTTSTDAIEEILNRDGCVIIRDMFTHAAVDALMDDLGPHIERRLSGNHEFVGRHTKRLPTLITKSPRVGDFFADDRVLNIMDRLLGPYCESILLSNNSLFVIGPNETPQGFHRDDVLFPFEHPSTKQCHITSLCALTDFTAENGATRVVPGSHLWDDERRPTEEEAVQAIMSKGSVYVQLGATYHGGGANTTKDEWRVGMFNSYILGWLRQEQNFYLTVPPEIAKTLPDKVARLIGYQIHLPFLGYVHDLQDPHVLLEGYQEGADGGSNLFAEGVDELVQNVKTRI